MRFLDAGEIFYKIGVFAKRANPATAIALEESGFWLLLRQALEDVLLAHPRTALQIMESMADRFISLVALTADLFLRTVEARGCRCECNWFALVSFFFRYGIVHPALL